MDGIVESPGCTKGTDSKLRFRESAFDSIFPFFSFLSFFSPVGFLFSTQDASFFTRPLDSHLLAPPTLAPPAFISSSCSEVRVKQVALGGRVGAALLRDGQLLAWGSVLGGGEGAPRTCALPRTWGRITQVTAGNQHVAGCAAPHMAPRPLGKGRVPVYKTKYKLKRNTT